MPDRIIAIGDIHGCAVAFSRLLDVIAPTTSDLFIPLGDYVDRGPDSKRVVELLIELQSQFAVEPLLGNHEEMMLNVIDRRALPHDWLRYGGVQTLESYGFSGDLGIIPAAHAEFLRSCREYYETDRHIFVHANYIHNVPLSETDDFTLRWRSLSESMPGPHRSGKIAVLGHTPDRSGEILDVGYLKCIDTFCYGGQWLTALDVQSGRIWQTNEDGEVR
jgi:serine/threonine protein phosphatase 1